MDKKLEENKTIPERANDPALLEKIRSNEEIIQKK